MLYAYVDLRSKLDWQADLFFGRRLYTLMRMPGCWQKADLAAAPMYATSQRAKFIDFTATFMDVYATILLRRTTTHPTINSLEVYL